MDWKITDINAGLGCVAGIKTRFEDPQSLISAMDTYHINNAVVFNTDALRDVVRGNTLAAEAAKFSAGRFSPSYTLPPDSSDPKMPTADKQMKQLRVEKPAAVVFNTDSIQDVIEGNALAAEAAKFSAGRLSPCYILRPDLGGSEMPTADELLKQLKAEKPAAVKLYPNAHRYILDEFYAGELLEVLNELHMPVLFDSDQKPSYESLPCLAKKYSNIKFILLRQPINESRFARPLLQKLDNVYIDAGIMIDTCFIEEIVDKFGSSKLLFGSGMPLYMPAGALGMITYSRISDNDKQAIFSSNWDRIQEEIKWA